MIKSKMKNYEIAGGRIANDINKSDFCFQFENQLYRYKNKKVKHLCRAYPEFSHVIEEGQEDNTACFYVFHVSYPNMKAPKELKIPGSKLASKSSFSRFMANHVPAGFFEGSQDDFKSFMKPIYEGPIKVIVSRRHLVSNVEENVAENG